MDGKHVLDFFFYRFSGEIQRVFESFVEGLKVWSIDGKLDVICKLYRSKVCVPFD